MKKFIRFFVLFFIILNFSSCLNDDNQDPSYFFYDEPAVVESLGDNAIVRTAYGKFCVPSLKELSFLKPSDILWSSFIVEKKDENKVYISANQYYYKITEFRYNLIDSSKVIIPANRQEFEFYLADDYQGKIERAVLYKTYVDSLLFFGFEYPSSENFKYELFLNPAIESENGHPTLYIRAKAIPSAQRHDKHIYAFDMTDFVSYYKKNFPGNTILQFNLKYYVGTESGKDVYREFLSNPLSWQFK